MKKMLMLVVCAVLCFAFYGCKEKTTEEKLKEKATDATEKATDTTEDAKGKLNDALK